MLFSEFWLYNKFNIDLRLYVIKKYDRNKISLQDYPYSQNNPDSCQKSLKWNKSFNFKHQLKNSLKFNKFKLSLKNTNIPGRASLFTSFPGKSIQGSMSVEAAIVVPMFLFCMANLLSLFFLFRSYTEGLITLHQQGREAVMLAYQPEGQVQDNTLRLLKVSTVKPVIHVFGYRGITLVNSCYMHKWTGYDVTAGTGGENETEEMVYITKSGNVFHRDRSCTYLNPSVRPVDREKISQERNENGGKYAPCVKCGGKGRIVYITSDGSSYHSALNCSALKRDIWCVPLSESGGRPPCSKCG